MKKILAFIPVEPETFQGKDGGTVKKWSVGWADGTSNPTYSEKLIEALRPHVGKEIEVEFGDKGKIVSAPGIYEGGKKGWSGGKSYTPRSIESFFAEETAKHASFAVSYCKDELIAGKVEDFEARVGLIFSLIQSYHRDAYEFARKHFRSGEGDGAQAYVEPSSVPNAQASPPPEPTSETNLKLAAVQALNAAIQKSVSAAREKKDELFREWGAWDLQNLSPEQLQTFIEAMRTLS